MPVTVCNYIRQVGSGGKFVVLRPKGADDPGIVVFSDFSQDFQHRYIVERWERDNKTSLAGAGLVVAGGGWWIYKEPMLVLYGQSAAYGRFDPAWLRERLSAGMVLNETLLDIR